MSSSVSIIICFYNASSKLIPTLQHIKSLKIDILDSCELVLVDNNSNDDSVKIIKDQMNGFNDFPWKIVIETTPGLSNARVKGISESRYEYLLFCDDDNWLEREYLYKAIPIIEEEKKIAVLGGFGEPVSDVSLPNWFVEHQNFYAVGEQMPESGRVKGIRNVVYGAGMIIRRSAWDYIVAKGFAFKTLGRTGKSLSSGEDSELCLAFQIAGFYIWYNKELTFKHYLDPHRLTDEYISRLKKAMNNSSYVTRFYRDFLLGYSPNVTKYFWVKELLYALKAFVKEIVLLNGSKSKRSLSFILYLLQMRNKYTNEVTQVVERCKSLSAK